MTKFLRKLFIKNYDDVTNEEVRSKTGMLAGSFGAFINILLFIVKLVFGILAKSISIITDGINNLTDLFSCFANIIGYKVANKPADKDHPYGHQRIEYIIGLIISFITLAMAGILIYTSITNLIKHEPGGTYTIITLIILGITIIFKLLLAWFYKSMAKAINSLPLKASAFDSISDVCCTSLVLIAAILQYFLKEKVWFLDSSVSIVVSLFILIGGIKMIIETSKPLIGEKVDKELEDKIKKEILETEGVLGIHDCITHCYGPTKMFMSIHVEVDGYQNVMDAHEMIDNIEETISKRFNIEITIHMDPLDTKNKEIPILEENLRSFLFKYNSKITFHDFRMVSGKKRTNLVFDIAIPFDEKINEKDLMNYINAEFKTIDKKYNCVIKIEHIS